MSFKGVDNYHQGCFAVVEDDERLVLTDEKTGSGSRAVGVLKNCLKVQRNRLKVTLVSIFDSFSDKRLEHRP